jgi:hypothetical protein
MTVSSHINNVRILSPAIELLKMFGSPVPINMMSWFEGARVTSPIEVDASWSKIGSQVPPSFSVFQTPPDAVAT